MGAYQVVVLFNLLRAFCETFVSERDLAASE